MLLFLSFAGFDNCFPTFHALGNCFPTFLACDNCFSTCVIGEMLVRKSGGLVRTSGGAVAAGSLRGGNQGSDGGRGRDDRGVSWFSLVQLKPGDGVHG